ncbi:acetate/propionate family kinase [Fontimonas sp. SYSU GA230001]|uniref:acetate/propionate family kinase n=1 Tax=Fontimonas sp. SYSU GA230001 TaxID=3142450 RepID=UPI0032B321E7
MTRARTILALNAGSSSLKFLLADCAAEPREILRGAVSGIGANARLAIRGMPGLASPQPVAARDHGEALGAILDALDGVDAPSLRAVEAIGHRIVHGGPDFTAPARLDRATLARLHGIVRLAPLHLPPALQVIEGCAARLPGVPSIGIFDTAFFQPLPAVARRYALPAQWSEDLGLIRHGFHGIAHRDMYEYAVRALGAARARRVISFQLGHGCSTTAVLDGEPRDTSMGYTPLEGLVMGTRSGDLDPGILLDLLERGWTREALHEALHRRAGLLGVSGLSADMAQLLDAERNGHAGAHAAIEMFVHRARKYLGAYLAVLGGADAIVFGGGIGEHAADVRRRICAGLDWAGLRLDAAANAACVGGDALISPTSAPIAVLVRAVDEERQIAQAVHSLLASGAPGS